MDLELVFKQGDVVLISVFLLLILMSFLSWVVIFIRSYTLWKAKQGNKLASEAIASATDWQDAGEKAHQFTSPIGILTLDMIDSKNYYEKNQNSMLATSMPKKEFYTGQLYAGIHRIMSRFEGGLTALASIGATAPFVGLFGTVWGIYHALINISHSGEMSIAAVAGPIGEALVATAAGLFVAIPAVLAYNALTRANKNLGRNIRNYAHELNLRLLNSKD